MTLYCTVDECKQNMGAESSADDAMLLPLIRQVSRRIDRMFLPKRRAPVFAPYIETRANYLLDSSRIDSRLGTFYIGEPILALNGVSINSQAITVGSGVQLYQGGESPYLTLQLLDRCCGGWYQYARCTGCVSLPFVSIAGVWGYNVDYPASWIDTLQDVPVGDLTSGATSFTVTDVDGANDLGYSPAFSIGNLLQIDTEWLEVTGVDSVTNTLTVRRGVNGSTAAAHTAGTAIYTYAVDPAINRATYKQVGKEYATVGVYDSQKTTGGASAGFTNDVLEEFSALLTLFANW